MKKQKTKTSPKKTSKKPIRSVASTRRANKPQTSISSEAGRVYLYNRLVQLYLSSAQARKSFASIAIVNKKPVPAQRITPEERAEPTVSRQELAEILHDEEHPKHHWLHRPYPYSGYIKLIRALAVVAALTVLVQIMYPSGRTLPLSRLENNGYAGLKTKYEIEQTIRSINGRPVNIKTRAVQTSVLPGAAGVKADSEATFRDLSDYPIQKRFIPFSMFFISSKSKPVSREINVEKLIKFTDNILTVKSLEAKNAEVLLKGTKLVVTPAVHGYEYDEEDVRKQVATMPLGATDVDLKPEEIPALIDTRAAEESMSAMQDRIDSGLVVSAAGQNLRLNSETVAGWIIIEHKPEIKTILMKFDRAKVAESLRPLVATVDTAPVADHITLLNGVEAGRKPGKTGRTLEFEDLVNQVAASDSWSTGLIQAHVQTVPQEQVYTRAYTRDSAGVQKLIDYWTQSSPGVYGVDMRTENGRIQAGTNIYRQFGGTYKLYLPHLVYGQITGRKLNPGSMTSTGFTIDGCVDQLVLRSHDGCAHALGELIGWEENDQMLASQGFGQSSIGRAAGAASASDGADWAMKLLNGSITTLSQRSGLISLMSAQNNRYGIPSGIDNSGVANMAGQAGSVRYDVAIIYHPQGTYVLSVFTDGATFSSIAGLAREINTVMSQ